MKYEFDYTDEQIERGKKEYEKRAIEYHMRYKWDELDSMIQEEWIRGVEFERNPPR